MQLCWVTVGCQQCPLFGRDFEAALFLQAFGFCYVLCPTVPGVETEWLQVMLKAAQVVAEMKPELGSPKPRAGQSRVSIGPSSLQAVAFLLLGHSCPALLQPSCDAWVRMPQSSIRRSPLASDSRCATDRSSLQQWWEIERWMRREGVTSC